jgi:hypothetical protein
MHINMYGERFEIVSDPFDDGDCIAVRATSGNDPEIRTLRLPIAILVGRADRFLKRRGLPETQHSSNGFDVRTLSKENDDDDNRPD